MKYLKHDPLTCEAPICLEWILNKNMILWYPGEKVCMRRPYTQTQKVQNRINKLFYAGTLKKPFTYFTAGMLERRRAVTVETRGITPNHTEDYAFWAKNPHIISTSPNKINKKVILSRDKFGHFQKTMGERG